MSQAEAPTHILTIKEVASDPALFQGARLKSPQWHNVAVGRRKLIMSGGGRKT